MKCKNCQSELRVAQKYCGECGAKVIYNRLQPKALVQQVNAQYLSIDNRLLLTFVNLFRQPEDVILGYINGTRKKYIDVLQYFTVALTLAGIQVFLMNTFFKDSLGFSTDLANEWSLTAADFKNNQNLFTPDYYTKYQGLFYIITVPFYALGTWLTYYIINERHYNFTEHMVISLYYSAQTIIITALTGIILMLFGVDYIIVTSCLSIPFYVYLFYILKRLFKSTFWETFARFMIVMTLFTISLLALVMVVALAVAVIKLMA